MKLHFTDLCPKVPLFPSYPVASHLNLSDIFCKSNPNRKSYSVNVPVFANVPVFVGGSIAKHFSFFFHPEQTGFSTVWRHTEIGC